MAHRLATAGRIARWLLLACTAVGIAVMHTVDHAGMHRHIQVTSLADAGWPVVATAQSLATATTTLAGTGSTAVAVDCAGCAHIAPAAPGQSGMPAWCVCLAVLGGLAVVLAALLLARIRRGDEPVATVAALPPAPRGPPPRQTGLTLATVAVLRV